MRPCARFPLTVVTVLDPSMATTIRGIPMPMPPEFRSGSRTRGAQILNDALKTVEDSTKQLGPVDVSSELMIGPPVPILVDLSKDAAMVVVGSRGRGAVARRLLGIGQHRAGPSRALPGRGDP